MSFILNALRKSEQERQHKQQQATLVTSNFNVPHKIVNRIPRWAILLMLLNLFGVGYVGFRPVATSPDKLAHLSVSPISLGSNAEQLADQSASQVPLKLQPIMPIAVTKAPDLVAESETLRHSNAVVPASNLKLNSERKKPTNSHPESILVQSQPAKVLEAASPAKNHNVAVDQKAPPALEVVKVKQSTSPTPAARNYPTPSEPEDSERLLPNMANLSEELKAQLPPLKINVFAYAELPQERFLIIDMHKYKIGDTIKAGLSLKDIGVENAVLDFNGQRFRIERP